jgi:hypothetical protein
MPYAFASSAGPKDPLLEPAIGADWELLPQSNMEGKAKQQQEQEQVDTNLPANTQHDVLATHSGAPPAGKQANRTTPQQGDGAVGEQVE